MVVPSKVHKDNIFNNLDDKEMRRKILEGRLKNDCDDEEAFDF